MLNSTTLALLWTIAMGRTTNAPLEASLTLVRLGLITSALKLTPAGLSYFKALAY